ncbi:MAG TPA: hypothetical protein VN851_09060 [Thermoanaerobaculia bacterium]|nr:hypothetical protein [Thermoanaerobaculia bacterium]
MILSLALTPSTTRRALSCALLIALGLGLAGSPALAAKTPKTPKKHRAATKKERPADTANAEAQKTPKTAETPEPVYHPVPVDPNLPSVISIAPHFSAREEQARGRREDERRQALAPRAEAWTRAFRAEGPPFARYVAETLRTLRTAIGRGSRNVCYPLQVATEQLAAALPVAPEARLETEIRAALARVANGARVCLDGRPATAQTEIRGGAEVLARAAEAIVNWDR